MLKDIAYDRVKERLREEAARRDLEQRQLDELRQRNDLRRQRNVAEEKRHLTTFYQTVSAAMLL